MNSLNCNCNLYEHYFYAPLHLECSAFFNRLDNNNIIVPFCKRPWLRILKFNGFNIFTQWRKFLRHITHFKTWWVFFNISSNLFCMKLIEKHLLIFMLAWRGNHCYWLLKWLCFKYKEESRSVFTGHISISSNNNPAVVNTEILMMLTSTFQRNLLTPYPEDIE
jgi:hypothetical protein